MSNLNPNDLSDTTYTPEKKITPVKKKPRVSRCKTVGKGIGALVAALLALGLPVQEALKREGMCGPIATHAQLIEQINEMANVTKHREEYIKQLEKALNEKEKELDHQKQLVKSYKGPSLVDAAKKALSWRI